jgi:outer membrane protein TolC
LVACAAALLAGCTVVPVALDRAERDELAAASRAQLFAGQEPITRPLTLYEATARAIKYQADYRVRLMEEAATLGQLDVAQFDLLPKLTATAGYSTRSNDAFGFGFTPAGTVATNPSASVERTHTTSSIGFTWNVLDFGVSYFRARQLADQALILEERRRKALQNLVQDVRLAWWRAEAAQRFLPSIDAFYEEIGESIEKTRIIESQKLLPPLQTASLRRALLDLLQQITLRRQELAQAQIELAAMVNAPPGTEIRLVAPRQPSAARLELASNIDALEALALRNRPELAEEGYKARVSENETRKAMMSLLPNLNLSLERNHDSNRFLVNNTWNSAGANVAFNLVKAFSLPAVKRSAEAQRQFDEARRLAMAMAIVTQTRIAAVRYGLIAEEFGVWEEATHDDEQIVKFLSSSAEVGIDTELELMRARARHLLSSINRDLVYANLEGALARIYNSTGMDVLPDSVNSRETSELARLLEERLEEWQRANFAARPVPPLVPVAVSDIDGVPQASAKEFREALIRILDLSKVTLAPEGEAALRLVCGVRLEPLREGTRPAVVRVALTDTKTGAVRFVSEFKTVLSEPVDSEQWRTLGEGAAYRVVSPIVRLQAGRGIPAPSAEKPAALSLRLLAELDPSAVSADSPPADPDREPLPLLLERTLLLEGPEYVSQAGVHDALH